MVYSRPDNVLSVFTYWVHLILTVSVRVSVSRSVVSDSVQPHGV